MADPHSMAIVDDGGDAFCFGLGSAKPFDRAGDASGVGTEPCAELRFGTALPKGAFSPNM